MHVFGEVVQCGCRWLVSHSRPIQRTFPFAVHWRIGWEGAKRSRIERRTPAHLICASRGHKAPRALHFALFFDISLLSRQFTIILTFFLPEATHAQAHTHTHTQRHTHNLLQLGPFGALDFYRQRGQKKKPGGTQRGLVERPQGPSRGRVWG